MTENSEDEIKFDEKSFDPPIWKLKRYQNALLVFWGFAAVYALRVNLSVAIVQMVPPVKNSTKGECANSSFTTPQVSYSKPNDPTYDWTPEQQGIILGTFFMGTSLRKSLADT
ncbi:Oidioi.mRNA.OKI2018_I69.chr1.g1137.t1.cds [Oikopleura dioica]|uniref:Oidioi.mRNA.OKI2018_I69.chr1.g1137.t1.cds n=1 Tax=Oikopleura dioica TaxID=34765 RepID=A0ABN7SMI3_OIKDI|nr:Oidioi.mRNA.OKI2018_I69.chr1.g1137.t1.cds [Oikopleura dioica]